MLIPFGVLSAAGAGGGAVVASDYELIQTYILSSTQSDITFSNLGTYSSTYKHLQIRAVHTQAAGSPVDFRFNGSTTGYATHWMQGNGTSVTSTEITSQTYIPEVNYSANGELSRGYGVIDILDPYSTTKNKTIRVLNGLGGVVRLNSGLWVNTSSITSISLTSRSSTFAVGSRFSIYGIKG